MLDLRKKLNELISLESDPKSFIKAYKQEICEEIEIECKSYLNNHNGSNEQKEEAIRQKNEMLKQVDYREIR